MTTLKLQPKNVDEYIAGFAENVQVILTEIRTAIRKAAPEAEETIRYQMPAYKLNGGKLVEFAAFKKHIGFYPRMSAIEHFKDDLTR